MKVDEIKSLRAKAHRVFDRLWRDEFMTRDEAYKWLAVQFCLTPEQAHISRLGVEKLNALIAEAAAHLIVLERRKAKRNARQQKRVSRESATANRGAR
jgi:hypothetical protein